MPTVSVKKLNPNGSVSPTTEATQTIEKDVTLWEGLDNSGFKLPHGCLNGACGACRVEIISGEDSLESMGANESSTIERYIKNAQGKPEGEKIEGKKIRLSCQAKVSGDGNMVIAALNS